uniref:Uncharacterized protein n=1 Tax=Nelumbo nucifera TaxID=4432 RepID=A0A822XZY9_NELNU|nr:TPA_asm: hypothetical protein HUJ06_028692 [Nelumbo nucifera]
MVKEISSFLSSISHTAQRKLSKIAEAHEQHYQDILSFMHASTVLVVGFLLFIIINQE